MHLATPQCLHNGALVLVLEGRLDLTLMGTVFKDCFSRESHNRDYIIDLGAVGEFFDSGIALLLMLHRHLKRSGNKLTVVNGPPAILGRCRSLGIEAAPA